MNLNTAKLSPMAKNQYGSMEFSFHKPSGNLKPSKKKKKMKPSFFMVILTFIIRSQWLLPIKISAGCVNLQV